MKKNFKKGKMFILLIALVMFLAPLSRVNAVRCGSAFFASKGGYIDFYSTSEYSGYCAPTQRQMFEARGGNESPYNSFKGIEIVEYGKSVRYLFETGSCSGAVGYKQVHDLPTSMIESSLKGIYYCRVAVYFDNPPSKDNFLTVDKKSDEKTCLKRVKLGGYLVKQNGFKYLDGRKDSRGYIEVDMKYCTGGYSSSGGSSEDDEGDNPYCSANYLQQGCDSSDVSSLQSKLNAVQGCNLTVDGSFGPDTKSCVVSFQSANGLTADGIAGSQTLSKLNELYKSKNEENATITETRQEIKHYKYTFDTDGGHFISGESKREVYFTGDDKISEPTIPGKTGYKFVGWYNGDSKYTFGESPTSDLILKAKWEKVDSGLYCQDEFDVLDYDNGECIAAQQFDSSKYSSDKFFIVKDNKLQVIQTVWKYSRTCNNAIYSITKTGASGSDNTVSCDSGYTKDYWKSSEGCKAGSSCTGDTTDTCERIFRSTCYTTYSALDKTKISNEDSVIPADEEENNSTDNSENDKTLDEIKENVKTGDILIFVAWVVGIAALGYSVYYFRKNRENNVE